MIKQKPDFISKKQAAILSDLDIGMIAVSGTGRITFFNPAIETILGLNDRDLQSHTCCELFGGELFEGPCLLHQTMKTGKAVMNKIVSATTASGLQIMVSITTALLKKKVGGIYGCYATIRDISMVGEMSASSLFLM